MSDNLLQTRQPKAAVIAENFARAFGEEVKSRRTYFRLTQEELSASVQKCGVPISQSYLSRLESGQRVEPNVQLVVVLAVLLDIGLDTVIARSLEGGHYGAE
jgi:transcriptional regulator with XRE-family HTH domain